MIYFRSSRITIVLLMTLLGLFSCVNRRSSKTMNDAEILSFHQSLLTLDTHVDTPLRLKHSDIDLGQRHDPREIRSKLDFPRMDAGGLDAAFFAVWTAQGSRTEAGHAAVKQQAMEIIDQIEVSLAAYPQWSGLALRSGDASDFDQQGKNAIFLGMENGYPIGT
ncbi:MAG: membrane dipeptidase, partial [Candidatus Marinimicrobia bacterium]|nr:membrane dipeptidase [Candidatus Neomarinimicrobiota bacterium]